MWLAALLAVFSMSDLPAQPIAELATVSGSVSYRQRIAMPPEAVLTVRVEDVSRADVPAVVLAEMHETFGARQVPIPFSLKVPGVAIDPGSNYAVRASITVGGELRFTTTRRYAVLTHGAPEKVDLVLDAVRPVAGTMVSTDLPATALPAMPASAVGFELPATFTGIMPCADCPGIAQTLTLRADGLYRLRRIYLGKPDGQFSEPGRWTAEARGKVLSLRSGTDVILFAVRDDGSLRQLDREGQAIESAANLDLHRSAQVEPISEVLRWRGEFRYLADAATFTDCASGMHWPVAMTDAYLAMERDYLQSHSSPGAPLLVKLDGRLALSQALEGASREQLVVERFVGSQPGAACGSAASGNEGGKDSVTADLKNTYWKLIELDGKKIMMPATQEREVRITLSSLGARMTAFAGCNQLTGSYVQQGKALRFSQMAGTLMACASPLMEIESNVLKMLGATTGYRIEGQQLTLLQGDKALARFEAVYLR